VEIFFWLRLVWGVPVRGGFFSRWFGWGVCFVIGRAFGLRFLEVGRVRAVGSLWVFGLALGGWVGFRGSVGPSGGLGLGVGFVFWGLLGGRFINRR